MGLRPPTVAATLAAVVALLCDAEFPVASNNQLNPRRQPSQDRSRDRVERILEATAVLLENTPVDKLTTAAIAEQAEVPIGSVYQYFPNKLAILAELARRVMEAVDKRVAELVEGDFGVLPWSEAIDHAVDATIEGYAEVEGYVMLLRSIRPTPEFRDITDASNARVAAMFANHPALREVIPADSIVLVTSTAVQAANALQDWALSSEDPEEAGRIIAEMKTLLKAYLAVHIERTTPLG